MKRRINSVLLISAGIVGSPAAASSWWTVGWSGSYPDQSHTFVDEDSIREEGGSSRLAWTSAWYQRPGPQGLKMSKMLYRYDCAAKTMTLITSIYYGTGYKPDGSNDIPSYMQQVRHIVPDSVGEANWRFVCEGERTGTKLDPGVSPEDVGRNLDADLAPTRRAAPKRAPSKTKPMGAGTKPKTGRRVQPRN